METLIQKQNIRLGKGWKVDRHQLFEIEPDNSYELASVAKYFTTNLFQANNGTFTVDLGFYGTYHQDRAGSYAIYLIRGDFYEGEILEKVSTRTQTDAVMCLEEYMRDANNGEFSHGFEKLMQQMKSLPVTQRLLNLF